MRWWKGSSGHGAWFDAFTDRAPGKDGFDFDIEYHIEAYGTRLPLSEKQSVCATAVRAIVEPELARRDVLRPTAAEQDVNLTLSRLLPKHESRAVITQAWISVRVDSETLESARRLNRVRQDAKAEAIRQETLRGEMRFLEHEVLNNPGSFHIYLLAEGVRQGKPEIAKTATELELIAQKVQQWSPSTQWVATAKVLHQLFDSLPQRDIAALISALRESIQDHGSPRLLQEFDAAQGKHT